MSAEISNEDQQPTLIPSILLLVSLMASLIAVPLVAGLGFDRVAIRIGATVTIIGGVIAVYRRPVFRIPVIVFAIIAIPAGWTELFIESTTLFVVNCLMGSVFFWVVGAGLLEKIINQRFATPDAVFGAISAYLLFGLAWAFLYWAMDHAYPGSFVWPAGFSDEFAGEERIASFSRFVYFSMVTMSTLGYGDITPLGNLACTLTWMQAVTGQFYVAVLVAWLVGALPRPNIPPETSD